MPAVARTIEGYWRRFSSQCIIEKRSCRNAGVLLNDWIDDSDVEMVVVAQSIMNGVWVELVPQQQPAVVVHAV